MLIREDRTLIIYPVPGSAEMFTLQFSQAVGIQKKIWNMPGSRNQIEFLLQKDFCSFCGNLLNV